MRYVHVIQYDRQMGSAGPIASQITVYGRLCMAHDFLSFSVVYVGTIGKLLTNSLFAGLVRQQFEPPLRL